MRAVQISQHGVTLDEVLFKNRFPGFEVSFKVRRYKILPMTPKLMEVREGTLGECADGFGPGLTLTVGADGVNHVVVVLQPENAEEQKALAGVRYERVSNNDLTVLFLSADTGQGKDILKNRPTGVASWPLGN